MSTRTPVKLATLTLVTAPPLPLNEPEKRFAPFVSATILVEPPANKLAGKIPTRLLAGVGKDCIWHGLYRLKREKRGKRPRPARTHGNAQPPAWSGKDSGPKIEGRREQAIGYRHVSIDYWSPNDIAIRKSVIGRELEVIASIGCSPAAAQLALVDERRTLSKRRKKG